MEKLKAYWPWVIVTLATTGISVLGCNSGLRGYAGHKSNPSSVMKTVSERKTYGEQVSDEQHKKDLEFIKNYLSLIRKKDEQGDQLISTTTVTDKETSEKIQKGDISKERPFKHYVLSYNIDANAFFITIYFADEKQEAYSGEKRYRDYNFDGLQIGTQDNIEWTFHNPYSDLFVSSNLDFSREKKYKAAIDIDVFNFGGDSKKFQRRIERSIAEYKKVVRNIARILNERVKQSSLL